MSKCDCTDSYICELCMPDTIDELATLKARNSALERVADAAKVYVELETTHRRGVLVESLAALDAEGEK